MSTRSDVFDNFQPLIKPIVIEVSKDCLLRGVITKVIYQNILQSRRPRGKRAFYLLSHVKETISQDETKCQQFLDILGKYKSCKPLVKKTREEIDELDRSRISQEHGSKMGASNITSMVFGCDNSSSREQRINHSPENEQNKKLDNKQLEAKLAAFSKQNDIQSKRFQEERDIANRKKKELENKLLNNDKKLEALTKEKDDYLFTIEHQKVKIAKAEKERHTAEEKFTDTEKKMKKKIEQCDKEIHLIEKERDETSSNLKKATEKYERLQAKVDNLEYNAQYQQMKPRNEENPEQHCLLCRHQATLAVIVLAILLHLILP